MYTNRQPGKQFEKRSKSKPSLTKVLNYTIQEEFTECVP